MGKRPRKVIGPLKYRENRWKYRKRASTCREGIENVKTGGENRERCVKIQRRDPEI